MNEDDDISSSMDPKPGEAPTDDPGEPLPDPEDNIEELREFLVSHSGLDSPAEMPGEEMAGTGPGETPPPEMPLDDLLSAEVFPEGQDLAAPDYEVAPAPLQPTFQLRLPRMGATEQSAMKKALASQGVSLSEKDWLTGAPSVSQLTEYQVIFLLQAARALGVPASATVQHPLPSPTEEDLALGDLSAIAEPEQSASEAAPSVALPRGEREVVLCSPDQLPGAAVIESFGIVIAHRTIARRIFREEDLREKLERELRSVPTRAHAPLPSSHLQILLRDLFLDLRKAALARGGNAVLGVKMEAFPESSTSDPQLEQLRLVAFGTAAVVEKS